MNIQKIKMQFKKKIFFFSRFNGNFLQTSLDETTLNIDRRSLFAISRYVTVNMTR